MTTNTPGGGKSLIHHKDYLLVTVPDGAKNFDIIHLENECLSYWVTDQQSASNPISLPPGTWQLIGLAAELTEEQWREIVESSPIYKHTTMYFDYLQGSSVYESAINSGRSLLCSHNLNASTTVILKLIQP